MEGAHRYSERFTARCMHAHWSDGLNQRCNATHCAALDSLLAPLARPVADRRQLCRIIAEIRYLLLPTAPLDFLCTFVCNQAETRACRWMTLFFHDCFLALRDYRRIDCFVSGRWWGMESRAENIESLFTTEIQQGNGHDKWKQNNINKRKIIKKKLT